MKKKRLLMLVIVVIALPIIFWVSSLIKCEILTYKHYQDFENAYKQNTMLGEMEYFKVLYCDGDKAEVYYVGKGITDANILTFEKANGSWVETSWEVIWSVSGSASEVIYPYWWHFIYGGV